MIDVKVWTVREFGQLLKISDAMAYRLVREGRVDSIRVGDRYLVSAKVVDDITSGVVQIRPPKSGVKC
jgi:excisionase family DNA binding protein